MQSEEHCKLETILDAHDLSRRGDMARSIDTISGIESKTTTCLTTSQRKGACLSLILL
jgi:hypothetical protein